MSEHRVTDPVMARASFAGPSGASPMYRVHCSCGWMATASSWTLAVEYGKDHRLATHLHTREASCE